jgi:DHA1 family bicyclomycin/chloramphenicol resistance-like MFS transporter
VTTASVDVSPSATPAARFVPTGELMSRGQRLRLVVVLGSLIAIGPLTIDMYLPALPAIEAGLSTTSTAVQLTLTGTLVGLAGGQLLIGPLSDWLGRRRPLFAGLALHVVASLLCVVAPTVGVLGALRVLQGIGMAATSVVAMAIVRDLFSGAAFARLFSRLMLVMGVAPILAPTLGGVLLEWANWRGIFVALAVFGVLLVVVGAIALPETLPVVRRRRGGVAGTLRSYGDLLRDRSFVGLVLVAGLAMAALFAYVSGSPFVLQNRYGLDERQFGLAFGAGAVGLIAATQLNVWLLRRYPPQRLLVAALMAGSVAGSALVVFAATGVGGLAAVLAALWIVLAAAGLAMPNSAALAMTRHGEAAGTAAALMGAAQFGIGAVAAPAVGLLGTGGVAMGAVVTAGMVAALLVMLSLIRRAPVGALQDAPAAA